jgi:hypothetical protein
MAQGNRSLMKGLNATLHGALAWCTPWFPGAWTTEAAEALPRLRAGARRRSTTRQLSGF